MAYLGALAQETPTAANAAHYAEVIANRARKRAIIAIAARMVEAARSIGATSDEVLVDVAGQLDALTRADDRAPFRPLDLAEMADMAVPERKFRVGRIMPMGTPGVFTGHGGAGKTQTALHLAMCIALGRDFFGEPVEQAPVGFIGAEDDAQDMHYRVAQQAAILGVTLGELADRLFLYDLTGTDGVLVTSIADGSVVTTARYAALRAELRRHEVGVVFLDNFATLCAVDLIRPAHATQAIALCGQLVPQGGNAVLIAHVDKATAKAGHSREAYSGTAAFHNRARWRWYLFAPNRHEDEDAGEEAQGDDGRRILEVQKVNAGRSGARIPLRILDNGAIGPDGVDDGIVASIAKRSEREAVLRCFADAAERHMTVPAVRCGPATAYETLSAMPNYPAALKGKAGKRRLLGLLTAMQADGEIEARECRDGRRHLRLFLFAARVSQ
jgi:hypothetical protein